MVHRRTTGRHDEAAAGTELLAADDRKRKGIRRRRDAIMAIKTQMLRCNRGGEHGRFKRGYLGGGDRARGDDAAIFYLACLVCSPRVMPSPVCKPQR
ncbi:hypothetical protein QOZ80_8AG0615980 [Eleusine coracana subsp. coracana]|nr:hypothetical protein QOZ80_8AG0615980 [Eleusine coracana subsp. coracana]